MADRAAVAYTLELRKVFGNRVLGPERPFVSRVALWYLQQIMLKVETEASMKKVKDLLRKIYESMANRAEMKGTQIYFDVDPA
jgi:primosomal protein N' (replication factor Y)